MKQNLHFVYTYFPNNSYFSTVWFSKRDQCLKNRQTKTYTLSRINNHRSDHGGPYGGQGRSDFESKQARRAGCTKLHVADVPNNCSARHLRSLFERFGRVAECDIVEDRNIAFVHIEKLVESLVVSKTFLNE